MKGSNLLAAALPIVRALLLVGHTTLASYLYAHFHGFLFGAFSCLCWCVILRGPSGYFGNLQLLLVPLAVCFAVVWVYLRVLRIVGMRTTPTTTTSSTHANTTTKSKAPSIATEYD